MSGQIVKGYQIISCFSYFKIASTLTTFTKWHVYGFSSQLISQPLSALNLSFPGIRSAEVATHI